MSKALVAIISDTHLPKGRRQLPDRCLELLADADAIIHAGDVSTLPVLRELEAIGPPLHAVHGNVDEPEVQRLLPAELLLDLDGHAVAVTHDAGPKVGRLRRLAARFPEAELVIFGHSHLPLRERSGALQIFNPGSPTERRRAPQRSMELLRVESEGRPRLEHVWLGT